MGERDFNRRQCLRALAKLGFAIDGSRRGKHDKFLPPQEIAQKLTADQPRFIMIPRHSELHCQSEILKELKAIGGEALVDAFKKWL